MCRVIRTAETASEFLFSVSCLKHINPLSPSLLEQNSTIWKLSKTHYVICIGSHVNDKTRLPRAGEFLQHNESIFNELISSVREVRLALKKSVCDAIVSLLNRFYDVDYRRRKKAAGVVLALFWLAFLPLRTSHEILQDLGVFCFHLTVSRALRLFLFHLVGSNVS